MPLDPTAVLELSASHQIEQDLSTRSNLYLRASGIGDCRRKLAYRILYAQQGKKEPRMGSHLLQLFETGHGLHLKLQERLSNLGSLGWVDAEPTIDAEGRFGWKGNCEISLVDDALRVRGTMDDLTRPLKRVLREVEGAPIEFLEPTEAGDPEARRYVLDIKTITARERLTLEEDPQGRIVKAERKPSTFERLAKPKAEHIQQVSLYAYLATQPGFHTDRIDGPLPVIPDLMMVYAAKDLDPEYYGRHPEAFHDPKGILNSPYKVFTQPANPRVIQNVLRKVAAVWEAVDAGGLPPRDYDHSPARPDWHCTDCPFRKECYQREGYFEAEEEIEPLFLTGRLQMLGSLPTEIEVRHDPRPPVHRRGAPLRRSGLQAECP